MDQHYRGIFNRIPTSPLWLDEAAVPRYDPFSPSDLRSIYAREAALAKVSCLACGAAF